MKILEDAILTKGRILDNDIIKVDTIINHQVDVALTVAVAKEVKKEFPHVDKVLTIVTSGLPFAFALAEQYGVNMVFAKKEKSKTVDLSTCYIEEVPSFTHGNVNQVTVDKKFLKPGEKILIADDFLASGAASLGLINICKQAGAEVVGVTALIEKSFQGGRKKIEDLGIKVVSGANIIAFENNVPIFG
ncbi:MAG: xanthine phosphoribosyltransferase [Erysipelotrichaceae bacterium]|nr:xanthine phosphoribosyltransferase [Erysipelotrichaceae bacterium]